MIIWGMILYRKGHFDMKEVIKQIIDNLGGKDNIKLVSNCMTRLRIVTLNDQLINEEKIKNLDTILGVIHDRENNIEIVVGPGKSIKYAKACQEYIQGSNLSDKKKYSIATTLKTVGDIFVPLIPGIIVAGICSGLSALLVQLYPTYMDNKIIGTIYFLLNLISTSFSTYITAWTGYEAAKRFNATPILGGMLAMIISLDGINSLSNLLGLYNLEVPLDSILRAGRGGVLAAIFCAFVLSIVEKKIREIMPDSLDTVVSPLLTILICLLGLLFVIMPVLGYVSSIICDVIGYMSLSENIFVRIVTGFISAAIFLPLVANGMHHGLIALYTIQLEKFGYISLYPALAMAGAGQVGAAIAIRIKAKKENNTKLIKTIDGSLFAGILGVGEPLIYGVTLPLGKPFFTAGLGAGVGGAYVMALEVASTSWGASGILGTFLMTAGPSSPTITMSRYLIGYVISLFFGFLFTYMSNTKSKTVEEIYRCCEGEIVNMEDIPDKVFSSGAMGDCFGIMPKGETVYAPMDGKIEVLALTGHSFCMTCKDKTKLLVHIGIDTVNLKGKGFVLHKEVNDVVKKGDKVISFDSKLIKENNLSDMIIVVKLKS